MDMNTRTKIFDFYNKDSQFTTKLEDCILMILKRSSHGAAYVHFTNTDGELLPIPMNFKIVDKTHKLEVKPIARNEPYFALCFTDNYTIFYNDKEVLNLKAQRAWKLEEKNSISIGRRT